MKKYIIKKGVLSILLFMCFLAIEIVSFRFLMGSSLPEYWYIDIGAFSIVALFSFLMPFIVQVVVSNVILIIHGLLSITNVILFKSSGRYFDWSMLKLVSETATVESMIVVPKLEVCILVLIIVVYLVASITFAILQKSKHYKKFVRHILYILASISFVLIIVLEAIAPSRILNNYDNENYFISDSFMFSTFESPMASLKAFGFLGYYFNSLVRIIFPALTPEVKIEASWYDEAYTSDIEGLCEGDNVIFILAESFEDYVISKATTPVLYALSNGIDLSYTGINNFYNIIEDPETGENKLQRKDFNDSLTYNGTDIFDGLKENEVGLKLNNYKSIESTNHAEMRALTGAYTKMVDGATFAQKFSDNGYDTNYIHGNYDWFYKRGEFISRDLGFENTLFYDDMIGKIQSSGVLSFFLKDRDIISYYLEHPEEFSIIGEDKFLSFMMTITTHGDYGVVEATQPLMQEYLNKFDAYKNAYKEDIMIKTLNNYTNLGLQQQVSNFMASAIDTEEAMALLINELYQKNILNKTTIVFVSDHYSYVNNISEYKKYYLQQTKNKETVTVSDLNTIPAFIYSPKIKSSELEVWGYSREINNLTSAFDLLPTVLTLTNIPYNPMHYMGYPVINKSVETGELLYNEVLYSSTNGYFYDDYIVSVSTGSDDDPQLLGVSAEEKKKFKDFIKKFYEKKHYIIEMEKHGLLNNS